MNSASEPTLSSPLVKASELAPVSVLITQCLQHDFVAPLGPYAELPNLLHIGRQEAQRLLGPEPSQGPLAQLMQRVRSLPEGVLPVIHIRDWHDASDAAQAAHLAQFGRHCEASSAGAALVQGLEEGLDPDREVFVNATGLNDFEGTTLAETLAQLREKGGGGPLRVGVVGVWTEAKVTFLLYELKTRLGIDDLATCSMLTASASRGQHFNALEQLKRILGVQVIDGVGDFLEWLVPASGKHLNVTPDALSSLALPALELTGPRSVQEVFSPLDQALLGHLYRSVARLKLSPVGGGFSGARVYRAQAWDALGHSLAPSVVKLGSRAAISAERVAFEKVEHILGNAAPAVKACVELGEQGGIVFAFASMGRGPVKTLKSLYEEGADPLPVLNQVFDEILGRFKSATQLERLPLLDYYGFAPRFAAGVRERVDALFGPQPDVIEVLPGVKANHVARFYEQLTQLPSVPGESHPVCYVHGDLNGANILVDSRNNVWVIDFFHTHRGHVLKDLAKLENDLLFIFTALVGEAAIEQGLRVTHALMNVQDLAAPLGELPEGVTHPALVRAWPVLRFLRAEGAARVGTDRSPEQLWIALLRYAVHTLSFDESSEWQKRWAFLTACLLGDKIMHSRTYSKRLRVDWMEPPGVPTSLLPGGQKLAQGRLGLTLCPGRVDRGRILSEDLQVLKEEGVQHLFTLNQSEDLEWLGVSDLFEQVKALGIRSHHCPIPDQGIPEVDALEELLGALHQALNAGESCVIHCMGGLGRTGLVAACWGVDRGLDPWTAIKAVRAARGPRAVENRTQESFVERWGQRRLHPR